MDLKSTLKLLSFHETVSQGIPVLKELEGDLFLLRDGRFGALFEYYPYPHESLKPEEREGVAHAFSVLLANLPAGMSVQVFLTSFRRMKELLDDYEPEVLKDRPVVRRIHHEMVRMFWKAGTEGLVVEDRGQSPLRLYLKDMRVFLCLISPGRVPGRPGFLDRLLEGRKSVASDPLESFRIVVDNFAEVARKIGLAFRRVGSRELRELYYSIFNPSMSAVRGPLEDLPFRDSIRESVFVWDSESIMSDGYRIQPLYFLNAPERTHPSFAYEVATNVSDEFVYFLHVDVSDKETEQARLAKMDFWTSKMIADPERDIENVTRLQEIREIKRRLYQEGENLFSVSAGALLYIPVEENRDAGIGQFKEVVARTAPGTEVVVPVGVPLVFQNMLPFADCGLPRFRLFGTNVGEMFPGCLQSTGTVSPAHRFFSPDGSVIRWDPFESASLHTIVMGRTKVGKSAFLQMVIVDGVRLNRFVFVLDRKRSYRDTVLACGGKWLELSPTIGINPFSFSVDLSDEKAWREKLLYIMSYLEGLFEYKFSRDPERERQLKEVLEEMFLLAPEDRSFDFMYSRLGDNLLRSLIYPFTKEGRYGGVFGPNPIIPEGDYPVVCYEIDPIEGIRDDRLSRVVYLTVLMALYGYLEGKSGYKYVILEEVPGLMKYDFMREAMAEQLQQYRKVDASITIVVQSPTVLEKYVGEGFGDVISTQVTNVVCYPIGTERTAGMRIFELLGITDQILEKLERSGVSRGYRDFYLRCKSLDEGEIRTFCRMVLPPTMKYLTSSDARSVNERHRKVRKIMEEKGISYEEALYELILDEVPFE